MLKVMSMWSLLILIWDRSLATFVELLAANVYGSFTNFFYGSKKQLVMHGYESDLNTYKRKMIINVIKVYLLHIQQVTNIQQNKREVFAYQVYCTMR